jgi:uncharacterized membrane protein YqiK
VKSYRFDAKRADTILSYLRAGGFVETAAAAAGISKQTFYNWIKAGEDGKTPQLAQFAKDVESALALFELGAVSLIAQAGKDGQWQAAAWLLERKFPDRYARQTKDQAAIEAAAETYVTKLIEKARQEKEAQRALAENREAERGRAVDVVEVVPPSEKESET